MKPSQLAQFAFSLFAVFSSLLGCGCEDTEPRTQVFVVVDADTGVRERAETLRVEVEGGSTFGQLESAGDATELSGGPTGIRWPVPIAIVPKGNDASRVFRARATALDENGQEVVTQQVVSGFVQGQTRQFGLVLVADCADVDCTDDFETCVSGGRCEDARVEPSDLDPYTPPDAGADAAVDASQDGSADGGCGSCDDGNPCTDDACDNGRCVNTPNDDPCNDGDPCTRGDRCSAGGCVPGDAVECQDNAQCAGGECVCVDGFKVCSALCIPDDTCCSTADCGGGRECPQPGGSCGCPTDMPISCGDSQCYAAGTCCGDAQCAENQVCDGAPGGTCQCPDSLPVQCGETCYAAGACCGTGECPNNQACLGAPGGSCGCPAGSRLCGDARCYPEASCCDDGDCAGDLVCPGAGQTCQCPSDRPVRCGNECYATCCPGTEPGFACSGSVGDLPCGRAFCNTTGDGYTCSPDAGSNCGGALGGCSDGVCAPGQRRECRPNSSNDFVCSCSGCF